MLRHLPADAFPRRGGAFFIGGTSLRGSKPMTTMSVRGVSLFVQVVGHGYPLVLMHGGPGLDHTSLLPLRACADQFTMVFYDHRCNGRSAGADVSTMTWEN